MRRLLNSTSIVKNLYNTGFVYPSPSNLTMFWNFGIYALICLVIQIITGIFLAMHYTPDVNFAFISVEHIMRDVNVGWVIRYIHANGASMFFVVVYIHILRGLYYGSYVAPRHHLWFSGVLIFLLMIITAFLGYVLPWGQMSFWGATVITNLASAVPIIGKFLVIQIWGGYSIDNATLIRFFSLHFTLPFVIAALVVVHLILLHDVGSNNPLGVNFKSMDLVFFTPYYTIKDLFGVLLFLFFFCFIVFFNPNVLGHPDNYIPANPLVTPAHIVPEWYFSLFYGILRSIPNKLLGVLALLGAIIVLFFLPLVVQVAHIRSMQFRPISKVFFWFFVADCVLLSWVGSQPVVYPYLQLGFGLTIFYFLYLLFILPIVFVIEDFIILVELGLLKKEDAGIFFRRTIAFLDTLENVIWFYFYYSDLVIDWVIDVIIVGIIEDVVLRAIHDWLVDLIENRIKYFERSARFWDWFDEHFLRLYKFIRQLFKL